MIVLKLEEKESMFAKSLLGDFLGSFLRHTLTVTGGFLVAHGVATEQQTGSWTDASLTLVPGLVAYAVGQISSLIKAKDNVEVKEKAVEAGVIPETK